MRRSSLRHIGPNSSRDRIELLLTDDFLDAAEKAVKPAKKEKLKTDVSAIAGSTKPLDECPIPATARPSLLSTVERGKKCVPPRILVYGTEGVGKSTLASKSIKPIFVQTEDGLNQIDCVRFPLARTFREVCDQIQTLATEKHEYETVALDSLDCLEKIIWAEVCRRTNASNIEKVMGGFSKGYTAALDEWREILNLLEGCRVRGMCVILIAHSKIEKVEDPETSNYDRHSPRLNKHAQALITEWVDAVLFATKKMMVKKEGAGFDERGIAVPVGADGGERILRCIGGPNVVAKNRFELPSEIPLSWDVLLQAISRSA